MEIIDVVMYLTVLGAVLSALMIVIFRLFPQKTAKKALDRTLISNQSIINEQIDGIKDRYESQLRSLTKRLKDYEKANEEQLEEVTKVTWKDVKPILSKQGINPLILEIPMIEEYANKFLKGKSIEEVQQLATVLTKTFSGSGGLFSNGQTKQSNEGEFGEFPQEFR